MQTLAGKSALLVGAKRIGQHVAHRLASEGVNLAIVYRRSRNEAEHLYRAVVPKVERACLIQGDVSVEEDVRRMVAESRERLGGLSFVVNLASGYPRTSFDSLDNQAWDDAMAAAKGSYLLTVFAARRLMENPGPSRGHIVLFGDWAAGETPYKDYLPYLAAKAAISFMTRAFAVELASHGILVNAIAPGPTIRPSDMDEGVWQRSVIGKAPLNRPSSVEDIAELVVTLLKSETITGETFRVDSGRHLRGAGS